MPDKLLNLKLDIVFQELFGNPKNADITGHLLSLILKREIYNQDYEVLRPSISILIADYELEQTKGISDYHTKWNLREEKNSERKLTNDIEMHILEIPKLKNVDIKDDELAHWLMFSDNPDSKEVEKFMCENKFWKQAREELAYLSGEENFQLLVYDRAMFLMDQDAREKKGFANGKAEGLADGKKEIAKKMKVKNIPIDEISELTGLSKEEIEKL